MDILNQLGGEAALEITPIKSLVINRKYQLERLRKVNTKYGEAVQAILKEPRCAVYLPQRFSMLTNTNISEINSKPVNMTIIKHVGQTVDLKFCENE